MWVCPCTLYLLIVLAVLFLAYYANRTARFYIRCSLYYLTIITNATVGMVTCIPAAIFGQAGYLIFFQLRYLARWTGIQIEERGYQKVFSKQTTPCVVICNHQSALDTFIMTKVFPPRGTIMMKKSLAYIPIFNLTSWLCDCIFVDRFNREKAMKAIEQCTTAITKKNLKLWVFPEGTRNRNLDGMLPFKKGAFNIAVQAQIPIVPIVASSIKAFYSHTEHYFDSDGEVIVEVMDPIPTEGLTLDDVPELVERIRKQMLTKYDELTKEVNARLDSKRKGKVE